LRHQCLIVPGRPATSEVAGKALADVAAVQQQLLGETIVDENWLTAPIWQEWRQLTRLQWSGRIAFQSEIEKWNSPFIKNRENIKLLISDCGAEFEANLDDHLLTIGDTDVFCSLILLRSVGLMENQSKYVRYIVSNNRFDLLDNSLNEDLWNSILSERLDGGIEAWSEHLMQSVHQDWNQVYSGKSGLVEVSIVRNALAHGYLTATKYLCDTAEARGAKLPFSVGERIGLSFALLHEYRGRIRSFCRIIMDGLVHMHRGTHKRI